MSLPNYQKLSMPPFNEENTFNKKKFKKKKTKTKTNFLKNK
jgi:hypothetical protein